MKNHEDVLARTLCLKRMAAHLEATMDPKSVKVVAKSQTLNHESKVNRIEVHLREEI